MPPYENRVDVHCLPMKTGWMCSASLMQLNNTHVNCASFAIWTLNHNFISECIEWTQESELLEEASNEHEQSRKD